MSQSATKFSTVFRILAYINLINTVLLLCAALLLWFPAPHYLLWLAGVAASELPLQIAAFGLILLAVSLALWRFSGHLKMAAISFSFAVLATTLALADLSTIYQYATAEGFAISWWECLNFPGAEKNSRKLEAREYTGHGDTALSLDIYEPEDAASTLSHPAVVVIHGGSWRHGRRSDFAQYDHWLAGQGYTVFDLDYRLCQAGVHFPAPVDDIETALAWINTHANQYYVDCSRIALLGRSAGAQLALISAYRTTLPGSTIKPVRCVVSLYGPTDLPWNYEHPVQPDVINTKFVLENYLGGSPAAVPQLYAQASALNLVCDKTPPTLFLHGGRDQIVDRLNVDHLQSILKAHKVPSHCCILPWANHGFDWHFNSYSSQINKVVLEKFLRKYLD